MSVRYNVEARVRDRILAGEQRFLIRGETRRHARIGEMVELTPGKGKAFATAEVSYRARILFAERGVVRVLTPSFTLVGEPVFRLMQASEQASPQQAEHLEKLAIADGFTTWADLVRWHAEQGPPDDNGLLAREVIGISGVVVRP